MLDSQFHHGTGRTSRPTSSAWRRMCRTAAKASAGRWAFAARPCGEVPRWEDLRVFFFCVGKDVFKPHIFLRVKSYPNTFWRTTENLSVLFSMRSFDVGPIGWKHTPSPFRSAVFFRLNWSIMGPVALLQALFNSVNCIFLARPDDSSWPSVIFTLDMPLDLTNRSAVSFFFSGEEALFGPADRLPAGWFRHQPRGFCSPALVESSKSKGIACRRKEVAKIPRNCRYLSCRNMRYVDF